MQENTNKAIAINSVILYGRLFITMVTGLFSTRFALQALGVVDYGLFSVVGSIISFIAIINTIMVSTSNRFLAVAIGKGDEKDINEQFNVNLLIHSVLAVLVLVMAIPIGHWYIGNYLNYDGNIESVYTVFDYTIVGSAISIVGIPYNGLLMAKERFIVFSLTDVLSHILIMFTGYILLFHFEEKLLIYTIVRTFTAAYPTIVFILYCRAKFPKIVRLAFVKSKQKYQEVFRFSVWVAYGAVAWVGKYQGAAILVNGFFSTVMNTAMGLANSVNSIVSNIAQNVTKPIAPQITKSYAAGDQPRSERLVSMSSRYSFLVMLLVASPFFVVPDYILGLWLGEVPDYTVTFTILMIVDALIGTLNAGTVDLVFATGKIKWYQLIVNTLSLLAVVAGYFVLKAGFEAYYLQATYCVFSVIIMVVRQIVLNKIMKFNNKQLIMTSFVPSLLVLALFLPCCFIPTVLHPLLQYALCFVYLSALILFVGLRQSERQRMVDFIHRRVLKK